jgi:hypothetical protein
MIRLPQTYSKTSILLFVSLIIFFLVSVISPPALMDDSALLSLAK